MEPNPRSYIYDMAKIEEPNLCLPKSLLKPGSDPTDDLCYMRIFEDDGRRSQHLAEAVAAGAQADRKVYRIRNKDLVKVLGIDQAGLQNIHRISKATIGILADSETNLHHQSYLDLVGTVEEVKTAEELIIDEIIKGYDSLIFPVILMPPTVYHHRMGIPFEKVLPLIGEYGGNILRIEIVSASWITIDPKRPPPGSSNWEQFADIYGPRPNVIKAMLEIQAAISEPWEVGEALKKLRQEFEEIVIIDETEDKDSGEVEKGKQQLQGEECGCSGTEKGKQQEAEDGETEKEGKREESDDESKDERRDDVEEASEQKQKQSGESETEDQSDKRQDIVTLDLFR